MPRRTTKRPGPTDEPLTSSWYLLRQSITLVRRHIDQVVILALLPSLVLELGGIVLVDHFIAGLAIYVVALLWLLLNIPAIYYFQVKLSQGETPSLGTIYSQGLPYLWRIIAFSIIYTAMVTIGVI